MTEAAAYDVAVIGAGPAGGHCARLLARAGRKVLLVDRLGSLRDNDFSSGGTTLETLKEFGIPERLVGSYWNGITIHSTRESSAWTAPSSLGAVLDFAGLREFLAEEAAAAGCRILLGHRFERMEDDGERALVRLRPERGGPPLDVRAGLVVDATGGARAVLGRSAGKHLVFKGVEHLVEAPQDGRTRDRLTFFLGEKWAPGGYSWVFPMGSGRLRVGALRMAFEGDEAGRRPSLESLIERILREHLGLSDWGLADRHGGTVRYRLGQRDVFHRGRALAVGDAVSCINPLGAEGIRHGLRCAEVAARHILRHPGGGRGLAAYEREMRAYFGLAWRLSELMASRVYGRMDDARIDRGVRWLARLKSAEAFEVLFGYRFRRFAMSLIKESSAWLLEGKAWA
ncbi:MAG TPA: NAD(P)/FAD-dependent oxidoreductase [Elusimicrobiota bacterium]|nr:NAD(P)/FAD-dependent oxidoreductase [Elusimicrobiota bacterium]